MDNQKVTFRTMTPSDIFSSISRATLLALPILFLGACTTPATVSTQQQSGGTTAIPASAEADPGLFTVYTDEESIWYDIPDSLLGRDMIISSRIARTAQGLGWGGDRLASQQLVQWERRGDRILLRGVSYSNTADPELPIHRAVENSNLPAIIHSFPIVEERNGSQVIDVSDLYLSDLRLFSLQSYHRQQYNVRGLDRSRSFMEYVKSFPENLEVRVLLTWNADSPPSQSRTGSLSLELNHSMILLPEEPMRPRLYDERVAMISTSQTDYGSEAQYSRTNRYVTRFRLEPSDPEAFMSGELVEPVKPIVFWIDPATPEQWRPYFIEGVEEWSEAFEAAGFKNAVQARVAPTEEEDPEFSLYDSRFSVIRYVANPVHSANAGPDVVDPRSGEIIRSHMNMFHNVMKRLHWWSMSQTGPRNPEVQSAHLSKEEMGEYLRYVVSHEMAHALGFPHNQRGNTSYPVDSLRSPEFTREFGNSASIVGRTRFNYVAQPEDGEVRVHRTVGEYDIWAVKWAYTPFPEAESLEEEKSILNEWVEERADDPRYQFGSGTDDFDPSQTTESIGDDWVRAGELGMLNLHRVVPNLMNWMAVEGENYDEVMMRYMQLFAQWGRLTERVITAVGGSTEHFKVHGQEGPVYAALSRDDQERSMRFLGEHLFDTPEWLLDKDLLRRFEHVGAVERIRWYQVDGLSELLAEHRLERLVEQQAMLGEESYGPAAMLDDLRGMIWSELESGEEIDTFRRNLQRGYLDRLDYLLNEASSSAPSPPGDYRPDLSDRTLRTSFHIQQSDIRPLVREQLQLLKSEVEGAISEVSERYNRVHLDYVLERIEEIL